MLVDMTAKSSACTVELMVVFELLNVYPRLSLSSHLSSASKNLQKREYHLVLCLVGLELVWF